MLSPKGDSNDVSMALLLQTNSKLSRKLMDELAERFSSVTLETLSPVTGSVDIIATCTGNREACHSLVVALRAGRLENGSPIPPEVGPHLITRNAVEPRPKAPLPNGIVAFIDVRYALTDDGNPPKKQLALALEAIQRAAGESLVEWLDFHGDKRAIFEVWTADKQHLDQVVLDIGRLHEVVSTETHLRIEAPEIRDIFSTFPRPARSTKPPPSSDAERKLALLVFVDLPAPVGAKHLRAIYARMHSQRGLHLSTSDEFAQIIYGPKDICLWLTPHYLHAYPDAIVRVMELELEHSFQNTLVRPRSIRVLVCDEIDPPQTTHKGRLVAYVELHIRPSKPGQTIEEARQQALEHIRDSYHRRGRQIDSPGQVEYTAYVGGREDRMLARVRVKDDERLAILLQQLQSDPHIASTETTIVVRTKQ
jgi:hypothetical protein